MARVVKKANERKEEILAISQHLFFQKGYDSTSVNDIIKAAGISKGAFYHHFASKDELMAGLVNQFRDGLIAQLSVVADSSQSALEKLNQIFQMTQSEKLKNIDTLELSFKVLYSDDNLKMRTRIIDSNFEVALPLVSKVVEQGINNGEFVTDAPDAAAEFILVLGMHMGNQVAKFILRQSDGQDPAAVLYDKVDHFERNVEKMLSLPKGAFVAIDKGTLKKLVARIQK